MENKTENNITSLYLDPSSYQQLKNDQHTFVIGQKLSILIKKIILNYYPKYNQEKKELQNKIISSVVHECSAHTFNDIECSNIAWNIIKYLGEVSINKKSTSSAKQHKIKINFRINNNEDDLDTILKSCPNGAAKSEFIANIIYSYLEKPQYERERIVFKPVFDKLNTAIKNKQQVIIKTKSSHINKISPKAICSSKEELYNYLLYQSTSYNSDCAYSIHLYNIVAVTLEPSTISFSNEINNKFDRMIANGVQYSISDDTVYKIKLDKKGQKLYNSFYIEKPVALDCSDPENGIYYFNCSKMQFENYFASFYEHMIVLEPESYRSEYINKISKLLENYKTNK